jgi:DNA-binding transcriptional regulator GbsR (MarR family)
MNDLNSPLIKYFAKQDWGFLIDLSLHCAPSTQIMATIITRAMVNQRLETIRPMNMEFSDILGISKNHVTNAFRQLEDLKYIVDRTRYSILINPALTNKSQQISGQLRKLIVDRPHTKEGLEIMKKSNHLIGHNIKQGFKLKDKYSHVEIEEFGNIYRMEDKLQAKKESREIEQYRAKCEVLTNLVGDLAKKETDLQHRINYLETQLQMQRGRFLPLVD